MGQSIASSPAIVHADVITFYLDNVFTIETTQIEVTLDGSFHDDGVDVTLVLQEPFSDVGPAALDLDPTASQHSIGGNGFIDGKFISGAITPVGVPEPSSALVLSAFAVVGWCRRRSQP